MTQSQINAARRRSCKSLLTVFTKHRNAFSIGWCAAFIQWGLIHVVQRTQVRS